MNFRRLLCLPTLLAVLVCPMLSYAQSELKHVLDQVQQHHNVEFSYVDQVIDNKLAVYDSTLSLNDLLINLERSTRLRFERAGVRYITIRTYQPKDLISLCGKILSYSGEELPGVTISYSPRDGVISEAGGEFALDSIPFGSWLTLQYVGYATKKLKVSRLPFDDCQTIRMSESVEELEEIVVKDYLATGISKSKNHVRIDPHALKTLAGLAEPDILQSIQQVPGVNSPFETAAGIHVRGGLPDQNLVLWNGIKTYSQGHFFGMISAFNPYITDQVMFIKHGTPAIYGDRISSVIDISSTEEVPSAITGGVGTNMLYSDGFISIPVVQDKLSIQLSARRSYTDALQTPTYKQMSKRVFQNTKIGDESTSSQQSNNSFYFSDFSVNSIWNIDRSNKLIVNGLYTSNQLDFESSDNMTSLAFNDQLTHENEGLSFKWKSSLNSRWSIDVGGSFSRYILRYDFIQNASDTITESSKKNFVQDLSNQLNAAYSLNDKSELRFGYHLTNTRIRYAYETLSPGFQIVLDADDSEVLTHSGFIDYSYDFDHWTLRPGVRFNYYDQLNERFFEPRLFVRRRLNDKFSAILSGEYRTQIASQIKESVVSDLSLENKVWAMASPNRFPVLTSYQFTSGVEYANNGWYAESEIYTKRLDGVTTLIFGYLNGLENQFREGESEIRGVDVLVKKTWLNVESWISYAFNRTDNLFLGINNDESFPGSWSIEHTFRFSNIINLKAWELSAGWLWYTGKTYTEVSNLNEGTSSPVLISYESINANNLPNYHRLDISAQREFSSKKHPNLRYRVGVSLLNVYNQKNLLNREFRTTPSISNELLDTRVYSLGITPNLVFRMFW